MKLMSSAEYTDVVCFDTACRNNSIRNANVDLTISIDMPLTQERYCISNMILAT
jgi:peroxiredoxin